MNQEGADVFLPRDALARLAELSRMLTRATIEYELLDEDAVRAKAEYEVRYAAAWVGYGDSGMNNEERKQASVLDTRDEKLAMDLSAAKVRAKQEQIRTLRSQIEVGRSINAALRADFMAGSGQA